MWVEFEDKGNGSCNLQLVWSQTWKTWGRVSKPSGTGRVGVDWGREHVQVFSGRLQKKSQNLSDQR